MIKRLAAAIALALPLSAHALSNSFSYQGSLNDGGSPASGSYDLQFQLQTSAGANVGAPLVREDVAVAGGLFSVELDFGAAITSADFRLQIGVRPGASTGAYTTLTPTTNIRPTPQAQVAGLASEAVTVSPNAITGASIVDGAVTGADIQDGSISGTDVQDGSINSADIADGSVGTADIDTSQVQRRVSGSCAAGSGIRDISATGTVTCEPIPVGGSGTVTSVASGAGLSGGPITTTGTLSIATGGVTSAMIADGAVASVDIADGSIATFDLAPNSVNASQIADGSVSLSEIDTSQVQRRVSGTCAAGSSIRDIAANGTVTCESDDTGAPAWLLAGNAGTNAATQFIGTTDAQPLVLRTDNARSLTITPTSVGANIVAGNSSNSVQNNAVGVTIAGGGSAGTPHSVRDDFGTVGGGGGNRVGNTDAVSNTAPYATVAGGSSNVAEGAYATVSGGMDNEASGIAAAVLGGDLNQAYGGRSAVIGGFNNCAGGSYSVAGGYQASVRRGTASTTGSCFSVASSGDANGDEGTFAWADSQVAEFVSSGPNQFLVRADGGVMINTNTLPASGDDLVLRARTSGDTDVDIKLLTQNGTAGLIYLDESSGSFFLSPQGVLTGQPRLNVTGGSGGVATLSNGGTWTNASSRSYKTGFGDVDPQVILDRLVALPISTWTYRGSNEGTHLGPMAEDFKAAFDLAGDGKSIATVDADGVALAAIQGLNQKLEADNAALRAELVELRALIEARLGAGR